MTIAMIATCRRKSNSRRPIRRTGSTISVKGENVVPAPLLMAPILQKSGHHERAYPPVPQPPVRR
ncbi:hypothetical protein GCM10012278_16410 [Nonomuraea glycinis]|uniref:Uncharacterized protein n=1 Tax=Nonomuraea glycinis TaxID=2047744 RepID=A0A918A1G6_9ACTN|nr:hypothetical protein GCM10012278_16410 [Nonomuraea glycinis]